MIFSISLLSIYTVYRPSYMYVCMYISMIVYMYVCMYEWKYTCTYVCMYMSVCMYVCLFVCMFVGMFVSIFICMYKCFCIYIHYIFLTTVSVQACNMFIFMYCICTYILGYISTHTHAQTHIHSQIDVCNITEWIVSYMKSSHLHSIH